MLLLTLENFVETLPPSALTATMAITAIRARSRPYSTMLAPRSLSVLNLAWIQVLRTKRSMVLVQAAVDAGELLRDAATERLDGDNGDDGDQGEKQAVLDHAGTTLAVGVELGLDPGLENEKVHVDSPHVGARGAAFSGCL